MNKIGGYPPSKSAYNDMDKKLNDNGKLLTIEWVCPRCDQIWHIPGNRIKVKRGAITAVCICGEELVSNK